MSEPGISPSPAKPRTGRGLKIALGLSLAVNLAILGMVGGAILGGGPDGPVRDRLDIVRTLGLGPMGLALERPDQRAIMDRVGRNGAELRAARSDLLAATMSFVEAVRAEPFDRASAEAALMAQRAQVLGLQEMGHTALLDQLDTMPQAARAAFADRLTAALRRHRDDRP